MKIKLNCKYVHGKGDKQETLEPGAEVTVGQQLPKKECDRLVAMGVAAEVDSAPEQVQAEKTDAEKAGNSK